MGFLFNGPDHHGEGLKVKMYKISIWVLDEHDVPMEFYRLRKNMSEAISESATLFPNAKKVTVELDKD